MKLVRHIIIAVALILIGDQILSRTMEYLYSKTHTGMTGGKINYLLQSRDQVDLLAIGNSRCAHHVIPSMINAEGSYNLSHNGMSTIFHVGLVDQLLRNEKIKIDTILFHLETHEIFSASIEKSSDIKHLNYYYDKNDWVKNEINELSNFEPVKYLFSSYKWNSKMVSVLSNYYKTSKSNPPIDGYVPKPPTARDSVNVSWDYERKLKEEKDTNQVISKLLDSYMSHILKLCEERDVTFICFTSPVYKFEIDDNRIKIIEKYFASKGIRLLNYSNEFHKNPALQSIWNWEDVHHLNENGAKIFSERLRRDL